MDKFETIVSETEKYRNKSGIIFKLETLFKGIELKDRKVLDIGGGDGLMSFWMAYKGADVYCLEPGSDGSAEIDNTDYHHFEKQTQLEITLIKNTFQDFNTEAHFDLILIHNAINHLNEAACERLGYDHAAFTTYIGYFEKLYALLKKDGILILSDCSRENFWSNIHMKNPFIENIEWGKHQSPALWWRLAKNANFELTKITWSTFNRLGQFGKALLGNRTVAYFLISHFNLYLKK